VQVSDRLFGRLRVDGLWVVWTIMGAMRSLWACQQFDVVNQSVGVVEIEADVDQLVVVICG